MEKEIQFHIEDFEGPLDLMLALVQKNKMSIYDIEIFTLIDQYLEAVDHISPEAMDSASAFITMAAHLVQMKSAMLLPKSEEAERMREELTGLLVEYGACKEVAGRLREMAEGVYIAVRAPLPWQPDRAYTGSHATAELKQALLVMAGRSSARRPPRREQFEEIVAAPIVPVGGKAVLLMLDLAKNRIGRLREVLRNAHSRSETVAIFLALLELVRGGRVRIGDDGSLALAEKGTMHRARQRRLDDGTE